MLEVKRPIRRCCSGLGKTWRDSGAGGRNEDDSQHIYKVKSKDFYDWFDMGEEEMEGLSGKLDTGPETQKGHWGR